MVISQKSWKDDVGRSKVVLIDLMVLRICMGLTGTMGWMGG